MSPTVTVAIPLHRSARWVDNVVGNVRALPPLVTEIVISDRTCLDDAADQLRARLADDPRVSVRAEATGAGFAEHYQGLVETATGELFMWMPHDDVFEPGWVPILAAALEARPRAWLAFGQVRDADGDGTATPQQGRFPLRPGLISGRDAVRMIAGGWSWVPFRGLFRRDRVLAVGLRLSQEAPFLAIDSDWVAAVALKSALVYDDRAVTVKRRYAGSTHTSPQWRSQRRADGPGAAVALVRRYGPRGITGAVLRCDARLICLSRRTRAGLARVARR